MRGGETDVEQLCELERVREFVVRQEGSRRLERERAVIGLRIGTGHLDYLDVAHGGVFTTLADVALSYCLFTSERPPLPVATATLTVNFLAAARLGDWLETEARIDRIGKRLGYASGTIRNGTGTIATMSGVFGLQRSA